jgi:uracil-DNA glycosylase
VTRDEASRETRLVRLAELYDEIWEWANTKYDRHLVKRKVEAVDPDSRLFIVGEAYARSQVRLTGINWFDERGTLGPSGKNLDVILRCLRYTVHPPRSVRLPRGSVQPKDGALTTVYTTDVLPCHPPSGGAPNPAMISGALERGFLAREFEILKPKVVLLLGKHSYESFHTHILRTATLGSISMAFSSLSPSTELAEYNGALVMPFLHPSPQSGTFSKWFKERRSMLCEQPQVRALSAALTR